MFSALTALQQVEIVLKYQGVPRKIARERAANALMEVGMEHKLVQRPSDRMRVAGDALRGGKGVSYERLVPLAAGNLLEANIHIVEPAGEKTDAITHQGEAVGYLLEGEIELVIDGTTYRMSAGDSFFFKAYLTNSYRNVGKTAARIIWVNTPQIH